MGRRLSWLGLGFTSVYLLGGWYVFGLNWHEIQQLPPNEVGDFLAGVFGPVAIFWLVLGFFQQGEELRHSVEALRLQAEELRSSVEQQKAMVSVAERQFSLEASAVGRQNEIMVSRDLPFFLIVPEGSRSMGEAGNAQYDFMIKNLGADAKSVDFELSDSYATLTRPNIGIVVGKAEEPIAIQTKDHQRFANEGVDLTIRSWNLKDSVRTQKYKVGGFSPKLLSSDPPAV